MSHLGGDTPRLEKQNLSAVSAISAVNYYVASLSFSKCHSSGNSSPISLSIATVDSYPV